MNKYYVEVIDKETGEIAQIIPKNTEQEAKDTCAFLETSSNITQRGYYLQIRIVESDARNYQSDGWIGE